MMRRGGHFILWLASGALLLAPAAPAAAVAQASEQAVKAAFLPKFARYVTWPPQARLAPGTALQLCLIGEDRFGPMINRAVQGQMVEQSPISIRRMRNADGAEGCHVAFVNGGAAARTSAILAALRTRPVLTVTDESGGSARGMIHFALHQGRVRFHIDDAAAARSNLGLSSRLLTLALSVRQRQ